MALSLGLLDGLHDAIDDAGANTANLLAARIEEETATAIQLVSRNIDPAGTYLDWNERIAASGNVTAIRVKLADNRQQRSRSRCSSRCRPPDGR